MVTASRPHLIGLTGSIGMGKSTTAAMFAELGIPVWDADAAVHRLYSAGGAAVASIAQAFPGAVISGAVDRSALRALIAGDSGVLERIENIVHPLVAEDRQRFVEDATSDIVLLDIPLLFESGSQDLVDTVVVVSAPPDIQRARVMDRPGMTAEHFAYLLQKQVPDAEKRARADIVIPTVTLEGARAAVQAVVEKIRKARLDA